ncbi:hypothetical protein PLICRDRAFT_180696 [Plicaturopsis crispa FD-325 SS-3]|uniref:DNA polymerase epsilon subunit D n=1 Tax=Plicaturopsis crispa FD-325 SS-3 TaxID=944288 RepID=A0A0C9SPZ0_PLICR|nr:hypothetical protein PLICRDRAFT_180696 [Plicaturopsis crispa FD-325 SS-3]
MPDSVGLSNFLFPAAAMKRVTRSKAAPRFSDDSVNTVNEMTTIFINYLVSSAEHYMQGSNRVTVTANDILEGIEGAGFGEMEPLLRRKLHEAQQRAQEQKNKKQATTAANASRDDGVNDDPSGGNFELEAGESEQEDITAYLVEYDPTPSPSPSPSAAF